MRLTPQDRKSIEPIVAKLREVKRLRQHLDEVEQSMHLYSKSKPIEDRIVLSFYTIRMELNSQIARWRGEIERVLGIERGELFTELEQSIKK